jgi:dihydroflavonol-4-reductase
MIVVTGGAGFIGAHLVRRLAERGEAVRVIEHPEARVEHLPRRGVEVVRADIRDASAVRLAMRGCDRAFHLAADPNLWRRDRRGFDAVNHQGTVHVLREALEAGARRVVHVSTESILAAARGDAGPIESARFREEDMIGPYCRSKFKAEAEAFRLAQRGAPVIVCSPTLPVGPGDRNRTPPTRLAVAFCRGELPAFLDCSLNMIDVRDAAEGLVRAMERGRVGPRYLLGGRNCQLIEWLQILSGVVGRRAPRWRIPYAAALGYGWISERWSDLVTHRMPMATVTGVRLTRRSMHFDASASLNELELRPRPIEESARDAVAWYREQGWI